MTGLEIRPSSLHGLGVFATRAFMAGDIIERCPVVIVPAAERSLLDKTNLYHYYFTWQNHAAAIALGDGSLYNHSPLPCARYLKIFAANTVEFAALRDIDAGHEITVDYTDHGRNPLWFPVKPTPYLRKPLPDPPGGPEGGAAVSELLVVVDMQNGFLREGNLASDRCLAVLPAVRREVDRALAAGQRVLFTADTHEINDAEFAVFPEHCLRGSREADLVEELLPLLACEDVLLVRKRRYSALFETEMEGHLHRFGIDSVRICGVCTDICVLNTTADLRNRDCAVTVAVQATGTFDGPGHPAHAAQEFALRHLHRVLGARLDDG